MLKVQAQVGTRRRDFTCPDNTAIRLPDSWGMPGAYLCCEDFDEYAALIETGRRDEAQSLLLAPPGTAQRLGNAAEERARRRYYGHK